MRWREGRTRHPVNKECFARSGELSMQLRQQRLSEKEERKRYVKQESELNFFVICLIFIFTSARILDVCAWIGARVIRHVRMRNNKHYFLQTIEADGRTSCFATQHFQNALGLVKSCQRRRLRVRAAVYWLRRSRCSPVFLRQFPRFLLLLLSLGREKKADKTGTKE